MLSQCPSARFETSIHLNSPPQNADNLCGFYRLGRGAVMSEHSESSGLGELIVLNGKQRGTQVPLGVPVTMIGAAAWCDVNLTGAGVGEVHCVVSVTPAGPALRSWHPDETRVNGEPTSAALLKDGDELTVGPCRFRLAWYAEQPDATPAPAEVYDVEIVPDDGAVWQLAERERAVNAQEAYLGQLIDARYQQFCEWFEELADRREELRLYRARQESYVAADKAKVQRMKAQTDRLRKAARQDRMKAKALYAKFLKRMKQKWSTERHTAEAERAHLQQMRTQFANEIARFEGERTKFLAEAEAYKRRLYDGWALLTDSQRRLLTDRQEAERTIARQEQLIAQRAGDLVKREHTLDGAHHRVEERVQSLLGEIAKLELRAAQARTIVQQLEAKRANLEAGMVPSALGVNVTGVDLFHEKVPLDQLPAGGVEEVYAGLMVHRRDLAREKNALAMSQNELERRAADLADHRAVLAEQVAALVIARQMWQTAECQTVAELETLARSLNHRELAVVEQEEELAHAATVHQRREDELWELRAKLEGWQTSLATHEATAAAARDRAAAELDAKHDHLTKWEASLTELCAKWATEREQDRDSLREELDAWMASRTAYLAKLAELDRARTELAAEAVRVAEVSMAVEEVHQELTDQRGRLARRKLRVHRRKWESHFGHVAKDLEARRRALASEAAGAGERYGELTRTLTEVAAQRDAVTNAEQRAEADRLTRSRELDERAVILSIEAARAERTQRELDEVRGEVERVSAALMGAPRPALRAA